MSLITMRQGQMLLYGSRVSNNKASYQCLMTCSIRKSQLLESMIKELCLKVHPKNVLDFFSENV